MSRFNLKDACVLGLILSVVTGSLLVGCGGPLQRARETARRMQNGTQVRGIQQGMVLFSLSNSEFYPGRDATGKAVAAIAASSTQYGAAAPSNTDISAVYALMLTGEYFTPEYIISPAGNESKTQAPQVTSSHTITQANYSFAMLQFGNEQGNDGRREEWRDTNNSQAPAVANRSKAIDSTLKTTSVFTDDTSGQSSAWHGNVGWNDNHVTFDTSGIMPVGAIQIGGSFGQTSNGNDAPDDLFKANDGGNVGADRNAMFSHGK